MAKKKRNPQDATLKSRNRAAQDATAKDRERFWSYVSKSDGCWRWSGASSNSYGRFNIRGTVFLAPRLAYFFTYGELPAGAEVMHRCDEPSCVRPDHLVLGSHAMNMADMKAKGRGNGPKRGIMHCPKGHQYSGANLYVLAGKRYCKECKRTHWRLTYGAEARKYQASESYRCNA